jgi:hypothetical protein
MSNDLVATECDTKEATWRRHVAEHAQGELTVRAYCATHGLAEHSFYWWRRRLTRRAAEPSPTFVPVHLKTELPAGRPGGQVEIVLTGDLRVRLSGPVDRQMLTDVLAVLSAREGDAVC